MTHSQLREEIFGLVIKIADDGFKGVINPEKRKREIMAAIDTYIEGKVKEVEKDAVLMSCMCSSRAAIIIRSKL